VNGIFNHGPQWARTASARCAAGEAPHFGLHGLPYPCATPLKQGFLLAGYAKHCMNAELRRPKTAKVQHLGVRRSL
jgi:hypothetical protein